MGSLATVAHLEQVLAYYNDPTAEPHTDPPLPPTPEIAAELRAVTVEVVERIKLELVRRMEVCDGETEARIRQALRQLEEITGA